jgi:hypothetical protein
MADAVYFRNLRKRERSASTLAGIFPMPAARSRSPFSLAFAIPTLHAFRGGDFRRLRIDRGVDRSDQIYLMASAFQ